MTKRQGSCVAEYVKVLSAIYIVQVHSFGPLNRDGELVGVGPGIGQAVAHRFAKEGYIVGLIARKENKLNEVKAKIEEDGGVAHCFVADCAISESLVEAFNNIKSTIGHPEVLVYNASGFKNCSILDITDVELNRNFQISCTAALVCAQQVLPYMIENQKGTIIFTGATASLRGSSKFAVLSTGKFALRSLAQSIAREFGPVGIHVAHVIIDGVVDLQETRKYLTQKKEEEWMKPEDIAETYWQLHMQNRSTWTFELDIRPNVEKW